MSKAEAIRVLAANIGRTFDTNQERHNGASWQPGARTLTRKGARTFRLGQSTVDFTSPEHTVTSVTATSVTVEFRDGTDEGAAMIHRTTYTLCED